MAENNIVKGFMVLGCKLDDNSLFPVMPVFTQTKKEAEDVLHFRFGEIMEDINSTQNRFATKYKDVNVYSDTDFIRIYGTPYTSDDDESEDWDEDSEKEVCIASLEIHNTIWAVDITEEHSWFRDNMNDVKAKDEFAKPIAEQILTMAETSLDHDVALYHILPIVREKGKIPYSILQDVPKNHREWVKKYAEDILGNETLAKEIHAALSFPL